jgi:hypothetical protein
MSTLMEPKQGRRIAARIVIALLGLMVGLALGEIVVRVSAAATRYDYRGALARANKSTPPPPSPGCAQGRQAYLGEIVRPSASRAVVYELKPGVDTCFYGARTTVNADGQRAPVVYARPKPAGVFRILFLGDSQTFARGVEHEQSFVALLQRELSAGGRQVEIINAGVPGYNTAQEAAQLRQWGMSYQPDCVMVLFIGNDLQMPHLLLTSLPQPALAGSRLLGRIAAVLHPPALNPDTPWFFPTDELVDGDEKAYRARVPPEFRHMIGADGYRRALRSIKEAAGATPVVNFADYSPNSRQLDEKEIIRFQRSLGIVHPDFHFPVGRRYWQSPTDPHLDPQGNLELTRRLLVGLRQTGACLPVGQKSDR